jgi:hypothetical protein
VPISAPPPAAPRTPPRTSRPKAPEPPPSQNAGRKAGLLGYMQIAQVTCIMTGNLADAETITIHGGNVCGEIANVADSDERIAGYVDLLCAGGPYTALLTACLPMALQILANHRRIPHQNIPGLVDPIVLAGRYKAKMDDAKEAAEREAAEYMKVIPGETVAEDG